jgi:hypothetical protein
VQLRLYIDGAQVASRDYLSDISMPEIPYLSIGAPGDDGAGHRADQTTPNFLAGPLDDVGLWTRPAVRDPGIFDQGKLTNPLTAVVCEARPPAGPLAVSFSGGSDAVT